MALIKKSWIWVIIVFCISWGSLAGVEKLDYWPDDWYWLWANKFNPPMLLTSMGGSAWWVRSGFFQLDYARLYGFIPEIPLKFSGVALKTLNSLAVYLVAYSLTRKKTPAVLAMLLFAAYAGNMQVYTWQRTSGVGAGFAFLAFAFNNFYLDTLKKKYLLGMILVSLLALGCYFGRFLGIFPIFMLTALLAVYKQRRREYVFYFLFLILIFIGLGSIIKSYNSFLPDATLESFKILPNINIYLANIGNLINIISYKIPELGGSLRVFPQISLTLGKGLVLAGIVAFLSYLFTKSNFSKLLTICFAWPFLTYFPNWIVGTNYMISLAHRYEGISVLFLPLLLGIMLSKFPKMALIMLFIPIFIIFMYQSSYFMDRERYLRGMDKITPVYEQIIQKTKLDPLPRLIVIHTSQDYISMASLPIVYGYFKGIKNQEQFTPFYTNLDAAAEWICAKDTDKERIRIKYGSPAYQKDQPVLPENVYAWTLTKDDQLTDVSDSFRNRIRACKKG